MLYGIDFLREKLNAKRSRVRTRYSYYEMKHLALDFQISTPPKLRYWMNCLGWCAKAVDSMADRLVFREFANDDFNMNEIYRMNNADVLFPSAVLGALISSCDFIYIAPVKDELPRLQVIDGANATGVIDPMTGMLAEGYAVLDRDAEGKVLTEAYFLPGVTRYYYADGRWSDMVTLRESLLDRAYRDCVAFLGSDAEVLKTLPDGTDSIAIDNYPIKAVLVPASDRGVTVLLGDADESGEVSILDVTAIQRKLAEADVSPFSEQAADVDGDGQVTIADVTAIQRYLAEMDVKEPIGRPV